MLTLADLDVALFTALQTAAYGTGAPTSEQPFAFVGRYAGPTEKAALADAVSAQPYALLRWDQGVGRRDLDALEGGTEDVGTEMWTVLVGLEDPGASEGSMEDPTDVPDALGLIDCVQATLNSLSVAGLWKDRRVRVARWSPALISRGAAYVYEVRVEALRTLPAVALTAEQAGTSIDFTQTGVTLNLAGSGDPAPPPLNPFLLTY